MRFGYVALVIGAHALSLEKALKFFPLKPLKWMIYKVGTREEVQRRLQAASSKPEHVVKLGHDNTTIVPLDFDSGWQNFTFGNVTVEAIPEFQFTVNDTGYVWITDAYCRGDSFYIFNNDQLIGETVESVDDGCKTNATDPDDAVQEGSFGHVYFNLTSGSYLFKMIVKGSPFLAGKAFIRLDSIFKTPGEKPPTTSTESSTSETYATDNGTTTTFQSTTSSSGSGSTTTGTSSMTTPTSDGEGWTENSSLMDLMNTELGFFEPYRCKKSVDGFYIYNHAYDLDSSQYFCRKFGMRLADVDNLTLIDLMKLSWDCTGGTQGQRFWVNSYRTRQSKKNPTRPFNFKPNSAGKVQLMVGKQRGKGSIIKAKKEQETLPFICQRIRRKHLDL